MFSVAIWMSSRRASELLLLLRGRDTPSILYLRRDLGRLILAKVRRMKVRVWFGGVLILSSAVIAIGTACSSKHDDGASCDEDSDCKSGYHCCAGQAFAGAMLTAYPGTPCLIDTKTPETAFYRQGSSCSPSWMRIARVGSAHS